MIIHKIQCSQFGRSTALIQQMAIRSSGTRSQRTLFSTMEMRTDEASATSVSSHPVREELDAWGRTRVGSETYFETQTDPLVPGRTPSISAPPPRGGASIPRASAPVSTGCLLLYCGPPGCKLLAETTTSFGTTGGFGTPVCKVDVTPNLPGDLCRRPPMCCLSGQAHGGPWDLLGNSWEQEIQPTSPGGWCAMRDDGPSTDLDSSVPPRSLPSPWGRHLSLASCDDMKLPTWDPGTGTKLSSTLPSHEGIAAWPWSCKRGCPSGKTLWSWVTTAGVSCATVQRYHLGCCCHKT